VKPRNPGKSKGRAGLLITLLVIAVLAAGGYYGFLWWQGRQEAEATENLVVRKPAPKPAPAPPPETGTIVETTTTAAATETVPPATTTTVATQTVPPATTSVADTVPLPTVTRKPTVISAPAPAPAPASNDATRARYDAMARDFAANASGNFTVQIQILCEPANVGKTMKDGGSNVWFVPQSIGARSCYRVFWGHYNTREEAQRALASIPAAVRDRSAAVKPVPRG